MKKFVAAVFAGTLALSGMSAFAADANPDTLRTDPPAGDTKPEKAKNYVKDKAHNAKVRTKRAVKKTNSKVRSTVANRKTSDPASVSESKPDATK